MLKILPLLAAYAIAPIVAGHGIAPMALFLIPFQVPTLGQVLAWSALIPLLAGLAWLRAGSRPHLFAQLAATLMLYASWIANILHVNQFNEPVEQSAALESMIVFSLPFQVAAAVVLVLLAIQIRRSCSAAPRSAGDRP